MPLWIDNTAREEAPPKDTDNRHVFATIHVKCMERFILTITRRHVSTTGVGCRLGEDLVRRCQCGDVVTHP
jgi:hypothetical protein